jgi:hypothetical protein
VAFSQAVVDDPVVTELLQASILLLREKARQLVELKAQRAWLFQVHRERLETYSINAEEGGVNLLPVPVAATRSSSVSA